MDQDLRKANGVFSCKRYLSKRTQPLRPSLDKKSLLKDHVEQHHPEDCMILSKVKSPPEQSGIYIPYFAISSFDAAEMELREYMQECLFGSQNASGSTWSNLVQRSPLLINLRLLWRGYRSVPVLIRCTALHIHTSSYLFLHRIKKQASFFIDSLSNLFRV